MVAVLYYGKDKISSSINAGKTETSDENLYTESFVEPESETESEVGESEAESETETKVETERKREPREKLMNIKNQSGASVGNKNLLIFKNLTKRT